MAGTKTSALAALTTVADGDLIPVVDVSDTTMAATGTNKRATAAIMLAYLRLGLPFVDVRQHGAVLDGTTDDAPALRAAWAAAEAQGKPLVIPNVGTLFVNSVDGNNNFVTYTKGIEVCGGGTIKVGTAVTSWNHLFGPAAVQTSPNTDASGLHVHDLTFDGNSSANPINGSNPTARRYVVGAYKGTDIRIHDCQVKNWDARNLFLVDGRIDGIKNIWIYCNRGTDLCGAYWHDTSAIFASGEYVSVFGNHMAGVDLGSTTPSSAWSAYEVHGRLVECHDNVSEFFFSLGPVVSLYPAQPGEDSRGYHFHHNTALHAGAGITIWPQEVGDPIVDVHIDHNIIDIDIARWPTAAGANNYPGTPGASGHYGVGLIVGNSYVERLRIEDNDFTWRTAASPSANDYGIWWVHPTSQASSGPVDSHVSICRNRFIGTPHGGILVQWYYGLSNWDVCDNTFHNIGKAAAGEKKQGGFVILDTNSLTVSNHVALEDIRFNRNKFIDDQATHTLSYPLLLAAGSSKTVSLGFTNGSNVVTYSGSDMAATDIRSNIESATAVLASADRIITVAPSGGTFTISGNAVATVTEDATITGGCGNTSNFEMLDTQMRIEDGTAIPLSKAQAAGSPQHPSFTGQYPYIRSATPAWAAPSGPTKTGSRIRDTSTAIERMQPAAAGTTFYASTEPLTSYKTADQSSSDGTNLTDVTGFTFPVDANGIYIFEFELHVVAAAATTGIAVAINGPASPSALRWSELTAVSGSAINAGGQSALDTAVVNTAAVAVANGTPLYLSGTLENGANAGTLALRFRSEVDTSAVTIQRGSWGRLTRIA